MEKVKKAKSLAILGIAVCGLCCALPVIGASIGMASLTVIAFYLEKIGFAAIGLALIALLFVWYKHRPKRMKRQENSCSIDCECKTESLEIKQINQSIDNYEICNSHYIFYGILFSCSILKCTIQEQRNFLHR